MEVPKEVPKNQLEHWLATQSAREHRRIDPVLNQTRNLIDRVLADCGEKRKQYNYEDNFTGYSYTARIDDIFSHLNQVTQDLFYKLWSVSAGPDSEPDSLACHITRQNETYNVIGGKVELIHHQAHIVTFVFDEGQAGSIHASVIDFSAALKLNPVSTMREQPPARNKIDSYSRVLSRSRETTARLVLRLAEEATKPQILSRSNPLKV